MEIVLASLIAAIPATIAAWAALKGAKRVKTSNGKTLAVLMEAHIEQDAESFRMTAEALRTMGRRLERIESNQH